MKKFISMGCTSTPSVKGIYTALFILVLSVPMFAQVEMKNDNTTAVPFYKWEVGVDLKPLFRQDEPYNLLAKWHFTERKALRLGLGTGSFSKSKDSFQIQELKFTNNGPGVFQYDQLAFNEGKKMNWGIRLGYQYTFKQGKVSLYSASDISWVKESIDFLSPLQYRVIAIDKGPVPPFAGYQSIDKIESRKNIYGLIQSLGFKYTINNQVSCSFETAVIGQYINAYNYVSEDPYIVFGPSSYSKNTNTGGHETQVLFKPLMGLFLNYHF